MDGGSPSTSLPTTFPTDLGSTNAADSLTPIFIAYDGLSKINAPIS